MWEKHFLLCLSLDTTKHDFLKPHSKTLLGDKTPIFSKKIIFVIFIYSEEKQLHGRNLLSSPLINNSKDLAVKVGLIFHPMKANQDCTYLIPKILSSLFEEKHFLTLGVRNSGFYTHSS